MLEITNMETIAEEVRRLRKAKGVSQLVLAQLSNVGFRFVRDVEAGKKSVHFDKLLNVLGTLGITLKMESPSEG